MKIFKNHLKSVDNFYCDKAYKNIKRIRPEFTDES